MRSESFFTTTAPTAIWGKGGGVGTSHRLAAMSTDHSGSKRITDTLPGWAPWVLLALGTVSASVSAILIRYASDADALAISFWRCVVAAVVLAPFAWPKLRSVGTRDLKLPALAGFFLAVHFAAWITSVELTSIALSVLLVSTAPVFVAIVARVFLDERLAWLGWLGISISMLGVLLLAGFDTGGTSVNGNILALVGGATGGFYIFVGEMSRRRLGILEYAVITYAVSAALLLAACIPAGIDLFGYGAGTWWAIAGLIIGPQLLGHTLINLVLSDIDATTVSVTIMVEPVIAIVLAFLLFSENPSILVYPGGLAIIAGIILVSIVRRAPAVIVE
jgi:drug/metabolite transporter (DMT)-like permease